MANDFDFNEWEGQSDFDNDKPEPTTSNIHDLDTVDQNRILFIMLKGYSLEGALIVLKHIYEKLKKNTSDFISNGLARHRDLTSHLESHSDYMICSQYIREKLFKKRIRSFDKNNKFAEVDDQASICAKRQLFQTGLVRSAWNALRSSTWDTCPPSLIDNAYGKQIYDKYYLGKDVSSALVAQISLMSDEDISREKEQLLDSIKKMMNPPTEETASKKQVVEAQAQAQAQAQEDVAEATVGPSPALFPHSKPQEKPKTTTTLIDSYIQRLEYVLDSQMNSTQPNYELCDKVNASITELHKKNNELLKILNGDQGKVLKHQLSRKILREASMITTNVGRTKGGFGAQIDYLRGLEKSVSLVDAEKQATIANFIMQVEELNLECENLDQAKTKLIADTSNEARFKDLAENQRILKTHQHKVNNIIQQARALMARPTKINDPSPSSSPPHMDPKTLEECETGKPTMLEYKSQVQPFVPQWPSLPPSSATAQGAGATPADKVISPSLDMTHNFDDPLYDHYKRLKASSHRLHSCNSIQTEKMCNANHASNCRYSQNVQLEGQDRGACLSGKQVRQTMPVLEEDPHQYQLWVNDVLLDDTMTTYDTVDQLLEKTIHFPIKNLRQSTSITHAKVFWRTGAQAPAKPSSPYP